LQRYLPASLLDVPENHKGRLAWGRSCSSHLEALLDAVTSYLPRYLVDEQLREQVPGQTSGPFRQATIMFADISGFTALSDLTPNSLPIAVVASSVQSPLVMNPARP
jgi:hypothetical protein